MTLVPSSAADSASCLRNPRRASGSRLVEPGDAPLGEVLVLGRVQAGAEAQMVGDARQLEIGEQTVKTHVRSILTKLGLQDRVQAAIFALCQEAGSYQTRP